MTGPRLCLSLTGVHNAHHEELPVVCRERADTEASFGGSRPLNHLQMMDF